MVIIAEGGGSARGYTAPSISLSLASPAYRPYYKPPDEVLADQTLEEMIAQARKSGLRNNPMLEQLLYIQGNVPKTHEEVIDEQQRQMEQLIDVISYATAIASFIPFPPLQVGGMLGFGAANVARAYYRGDHVAGARYLNQLSRTLSNRYGYGRKGYQNYRQYPGDVRRYY